MRHVGLLVAILAFVPLASATAQVPVRPGEQVRVTHPPICPADTICVGPSPRQRSVGTFLAWKADSLVVQSNGDTLSVPVNLVTRLDVSRGRKSFGAGRGGIIGGLVGAASGAIIGAASYEEPEEPQPCVPRDFLDCLLRGPRGDRISRTAADAAVQWAVVGAVVGYAIGRLLGSAIKTERWEEVPLDRLRVNLGPQRDGRYGLGASVGF